MNGIMVCKNAMNKSQNVIINHFLLSLPHSGGTTDITKSNDAARYTDLI